MSDDCPHPDFAARVETHRLTDDAGRVRNYVAEIAISCAQCGEPFHFVGPPAGLSFYRPMVNVGATVLHAPIAPGRGPSPDGMRIEMGSKPTAEEN